MSVLPGYPSYTKIPFRKSRLYQRQKKGHLNLEKTFHGNKKIISGNMRTPRGDQSLLLSNLLGRRSPSYFTALQDINNLEN